MKILNYGSMNIDNVYSVEHMARPGETILATGRGVFCGGKGLNQSIAIAKAGGQVCHAGIVGEDGGMLLDDGAVDPGMEAVPEAGTEEGAVSDGEEYVEDGAAELEGSPMEGLAR